MLLNLEIRNARISYLILGIVVLVFTSCDDSTEQPSDDINSSAAMAEIVMGLGNIVRDGFSELEQEANVASTNEGGVSDSTRFAAYLERHFLRAGALGVLEDRLNEITPTASESSAHSDALKLIRMIEDAHAENFPLIIDYIKTGLDQADKAKINPFAVLSRKRMEINQLLAQVEGQVKALNQNN